MFEVRCEQCQSPFDVDERRVPRGGMQMRCPKCNASLLVKRPAAAPPPPPPGANPRGTLAFNAAADAPATPARQDAALPVPLRPGARPPPPRADVGLPALMGGEAALPALMGGEAAALPALMDDIGLPLPMDENAALPLPKDENAALPLPKEARVAAPTAKPPVADLPKPLGARADLPQTMDSGVGLPARVDFDAGLPSPMDMGAALPSPKEGGADLPVVRDFDFDLPSLTAPLPAPSGTHLPTPSAALPTVRDFSQPPPRGAPPAATQAPIAVVGAARAAPMEFDAPGEPILFDDDEADLPLAADNLPMSVDFPVLAENLPTSVDLPISAEALPVASDFGPEVPGLEPDALPPIMTSPTMQAKEGAKLGRIGLERKAFTVNDDLPAVSPGAALPAVSGRGRRRIEEEVKAPPRRNPAASPFVIDSVPPPEEPRGARQAAPLQAQGGGFGDLDLGPMSLDSAPPSFGYAQPIDPPMPQGLMAPPSPQFISGPPAAPSLPPLDNPFDPGVQSIAPPPGASMQPAPIVDDILGSFDSGASMPPASSPEFDPPMKAPDAADKSVGRFGKKTSIDLGAPVDNPARRRRAMYALYGALGVLGVAIIGGAALALTPYGAFGKNWIDDALHGEERLAAANRVIQEVERTLEQDTYERALAGLRRLDQAVVRVPQVKDLQAYVVYANNLVAARFGPEPARIGRARQVLATLAEAPPGTRYLNLARASDALLRGNAREALRMAKLDPAGRDLATLAAERVGDQEQLLRLAREGRQRHPSPRSRYLLARAAATRSDPETARQEAEAVLRAEPRHAGARVLLARLLTRHESERDRAVELLRDLVGAGRGAQGQNPTGASVSERAEACVVSGQVEFLRDHVTAAQARFQRALELDPRSASALVGIGQILSRQGNFSDAVARFRNALSADRNNLDAVIGIAQASLALGQAGDARQAIEPAIRDNPTDGRLHYWLGRSLAATSDQRTVAQQSFREAIRLQPASLDAYVALSEMLLSMQRTDQADQVLMEARARVPESSAIHRALAHGRLVRGDLAGAEGELRVALQRDARDIRAHFALGDVLRRMQRLDDAQHEFEAVAEMDASYPGLAMARGQLAEARGELPQALQTFREALARDPTNVELIVRVATTLVSLGNFGDADQMLRSVVVDHSSNADAQYTMGRARLGQEQYVDAVHYLDRAIELNPTKAEYKAYAAEAHRRAGDIQRALQLAEQSIEADPSFPRGYWVRAEIRLHRGDASDALSDINRATQLDPRFWAAYATWADIDDSLGRRAEAIRLYRFAIERAPRHGDWHYNLGRLLADSGEEGGARAAFVQAREIGGGVAPVPSWFVQATRALADIERERHNRSEAQRLYTEYLRFVPSGSAAYNSAALALSDMLHE